MSISQVNPQFQWTQPSVGTIGEPIAGTQRPVQLPSHWWVQHPEDEPLPGCNIPVSLGQTRAAGNQDAQDDLIAQSHSGYITWVHHILDGIPLVCAGSPTTLCSARHSTERPCPLPFASFSVCPRAPSGVVTSLQSRRKPR